MSDIQRIHRIFIPETTYTESPGYQTRNEAQDKNSLCNNKDCIISQFIELFELFRIPPYTERSVDLLSCTIIIAWIGTSLVAQWLRIRLPMQGTRVQALVQEDPTCRRATKPVRHNYWACEPQLLKPVCLEPVLCNKRSHCSEKPVHRNEE